MRGEPCFYVPGKTHRHPRIIRGFTVSEMPSMFPLRPPPTISDDEEFLLTSVRLSGQTQNFEIPKRLAFSRHVCRASILSLV